MDTATGISLTTFESHVLHFTAHYGLAVAEALPRVGKCNSHEVAEQVLNGLVQRGLLTASWLYYGRRCYRVTARAAEALADGVRLTVQDASPLSAEARIRRFAMLSFCCLGVTPRTKLTMAQLRQLCPVLEPSPRTGSYYADHSSPQRIGLLRVDMGGHGRWDRILAKASADARIVRNMLVWRELVAEDRFEITVATALPQKAERLHRALETEPAVLPIRIAVIPDLLNIIAPSPP
jgi:hypothetical protein